MKLNSRYGFVLLLVFQFVFLLLLLKSDYLCVEYGGYDPDQGPGSHVVSGSLDDARSFHSLLTLFDRFSKASFARVCLTFFIVPGIVFSGWLIYCCITGASSNVSLWIMKGLAVCELVLGAVLVWVTENAYIDLGTRYDSCADGYNRAAYFFSFDVSSYVVLGLGALFCVSAFFFAGYCMREGKKNAEKNKMLQGYRVLLWQGIITQEEFEQKQKELSEKYTSHH